MNYIDDKQWAKRERKDIDTGSEWDKAHTDYN